MDVAYSINSYTCCGYWKIFTKNTLFRRTFIIFSFNNLNVIHQPKIRFVECRVWDERNQQKIVLFSFPFLFIFQSWLLLFCHLLLLLEISTAVSGIFKHLNQNCSSSFWFSSHYIYWLTIREKNMIKVWLTWSKDANFISWRWKWRLWFLLILWIQNNQNHKSTLCCFLNYHSTLNYGLNTEVKS